MTLGRAGGGNFKIAMLALLPLSVAGHGCSSARESLGTGEPLTSIKLLAHESTLESWLQPHPWRGVLAGPIGVIVSGDARDPAFARRLFARIFAAFPSHSTVLPSEGYAYFTAAVDGRHLSGNIRVSDARTGTLHFGYFDVHDEGFVGGATLTASDGVLVSVGRLASNSAELVDQVTVVADGVVRRFDYVRSTALQPAPRGLGPGEEFVARITDEAGWPLLLVWNAAESTFLYQLDFDGRANDQLLLVQCWPELDLLVADRSRYAFVRVRSSSRVVLIGVLARHIRDNSFSDGPFDQVPPDLELRDKLYAMYPAIRNSRPIDRHGNYVDMPGVRVAISAYRPYAALAELVTRIEDSDRGGPNLEARLADPRLKLPKADEVGPHDLEVSRGWPPFHLVPASRTERPSSASFQTALAAAESTRGEGHGSDSVPPRRPGRPACRRRRQSSRRPARWRTDRRRHDRLRPRPCGCPITARVQGCLSPELGPQPCAAWSPQASGGDRSGVCGVRRQSCRFRASRRLLCASSAYGVRPEVAAHDPGFVQLCTPWRSPV